MKTTYLSILLTAVIAITVYAARPTRDVTDRFRDEINGLRDEIKALKTNNRTLEIAVARMSWLLASNNVDPSPIQNESFWPDNRLYDPLNIGTTGSLEGAKVMQILSKDQMLVTVYTGHKNTLMIKGVGTVNLSNDESVKFPSAMVVVGNTTYTTAIGGTNTVMVLTPVNDFPDTGVRYK